MSAKKSSPHALLCWERGGGTGHIVKLSIVGKSLFERGWRVSCLARYPVSAYRLLGELLDNLFQSPALRPLQDSGMALRKPSLDFTDILAYAGFADAASLSCQLRQLDSIFTAAAPDLIVADFAPVTCLASRGRIPTIRLGSSFCLPPSTIDRFPRLRKDGERASDPEKLYSTVRKVCESFGMQQPESLPQAIGGDIDIVTCHPAFDIYAKFRHQSASGPLLQLFEPLAAPQSTNIFYYLAGDYQPNEKILEALIETGIPLRGYLRGPTDRQRALCRDAGVHYSEEPLDTQRELASAAAIVHNGGINLLHEAASAGRYQIVFPRHLEQQLNASLLRRHGIGEGISPHLEATQIKRLVIKLIAGLPDHTALRRVAQNLQSPGNSLEKFLMVADKLVERNI